MAGRPTKYKDEYCDYSKYLAKCEDAGELPSLCGYACFLDVAESTLELWQSKHKQFSGSLSKLLTIEKKTLINKGLNGTYNATIAKLLLSANHDMKEQSIVEEKISGDVVFTENRKD
jgi:hypothetical protein